MNTYSPKASEIKRDWHLVDVKDKVLGRISTEIAKFLIGKHKKTYSANLDSGDFVVVINAGLVRVTGRKESQKTYYRHTGFPKGLRSVKLNVLRETQPAKIIANAVWNMLPKNKLRKDRMTRLKVFAEGNHPYKDKFLISKS